MRTLPRLVALACAFAGGLVASCELPRGRSCGDGWWDPEYEDCDPSSPDDGYLSACRERGLGLADARCDPSTCEIQASEADCVRCGDGVAAGSEQCDGADLRGAKCPDGSTAVRCTDSCALDYELCPPVCGDGIISGAEECEPSIVCARDADCAPGSRCYLLFGQCVPIHGYGSDLDCSSYTTRALGMNKSYASGTIERCTTTCVFGRNNCGFCGDGVLDSKHQDYVYPNGAVLAVGIDEVCDGDRAVQKDLHEHCRRRCVDDDEAINADVFLECEFQCNAACTGFLTHEDLDEPAAGCCLAKHSPCPNFEFDGVPSLPCCSWLSNPTWMAEQKCVSKITTGHEPDIALLVCP
jgi:hypothetical protein